MFALYYTIFCFTTLCYYPSDTDLHFHDTLLCGCRIEYAKPITLQVVLHEETLLQNFLQIQKRNASELVENLEEIFPRYLKDICMI